MSENENRVNEMVAALSRAIGEVLQDNPGGPMCIVCGVMDGSRFASLIGGGAHVDAPIFDRNLTLIAGDLCHTRGGNEYTDILNYKNADEALNAKASDGKSYTGERDSKPAWPFPTGTKN